LKNIVIIIIISFLSFSISAQTKINVDYANPKSYEIGGITVSGADHLNNNTLIAITGLTVGESIKVPGDKVPKAISKLWDQGLFSDVDIIIEKIVENAIFLNIIVIEYPRLSKFKFVGRKVRKSDITTLKEELKLMRGKVLTQNLINNNINSIKKYFVNKGFYNVRVGYLTTPDTTTSNSNNLIFNISKGQKIKIKEILINGRNKIINDKKSLVNKKDSIFPLSSYTLSKSMKETKSKSFWRFWKASKFIEENYENDKKKYYCEI
jgi:outer membrane protein insertion porin family